MKLDPEKIRQKLTNCEESIGKDGIDAIVDALSEKKQAAGQTALDAAKTFITLASGVLVGLIGYVSYTIKPGDELNLIQLGIYTLAAIFLVAVMISGMVALSKTWKDPAWTAESLRTYLNRQAGFGLLAIVSFAVAFIVGHTFKAAGSAAPVSIAISTANTEAVAADRRITVTGRWSGDLLLKPATGPAITIPAPAKGEEGSFELEWK